MNIPLTQELIDDMGVSTYSHVIATGERATKGKNGGTVYRCLEPQ
mgnify:CR=1 FL=1